MSRPVCPVCGGTSEQFFGMSCEVGGCACLYPNKPDTTASPAPSPYQYQDTGGYKPEEGWINRQVERVEQEAQTWPKWMRRESSSSDERIAALQAEIEQRAREAASGGGMARSHRRAGRPIMTPCGMDPSREQQAHATTSKLNKAERSARALLWYARRLRCLESKRLKLKAESIVAIRRPKGSGRGTRKQTRSKTADAGR